MPVVERMDGFIGLAFLADRCIVATARQTEEAMHARMEAEEVAPRQRRRG